MIGWGCTCRDTARIYASAIARSDLVTDRQKYLAVPRSDYVFTKETSFLLKGVSSAEIWLVGLFNIRLSLDRCHSSDCQTAALQQLEG